MNVDADTLDGIQGASFLRSDANDVATGRIVFNANETNNWDTIATSTGSLGCIEIKNAGAGNDAFLTFHAGSDFACYFGLDADTNDISVGGWSFGANKYKVWHAGNDGSGSGLDADTLDGQEGSHYLAYSNFTGTVPDADITDIGNTQAGIITFDNLEKGNLSVDGQLAFDSSQGLLLYRAQQGTTGAVSVLDGANVDAGSGISITNLGTGGTAQEPFTFSIDSTVITTTTMTDHSLNPNFGTTIGMGNDTAVISFNDGTNETRTDYWENLDGLSIQGDGNSTAAVVLKTGNLDISGAAYIAGRVGIGGDLYIPSKIIHEGDTNTYFQFEAADKVRIVVNGGEVMEWGNNYARLNDSDQLRLGTGSDFRIYFNGADTVIRNYAHADGDIIFQGENSAGTNQNILIMKTDGTRTYNVLYENNAERFRTTSAGVTVTGALTATGDVTAFSDITLKKDIEVIPNALDKVSQIRGVTYKRTDTEEPLRQAGVIAQEVEEVLPEVVHTNEDGIKSVAYGNLVSLLIESVKELKARVEELENN